jgi:Domain of unknown function (DUF4149)
MNVEARETQTLTASNEQAQMRRWPVGVHYARLWLLAAWLGASVFFSFVVAPSAFAVLPTHELAGNLVTRTLAVVNISGVVMALLLIISAHYSWLATTNPAMMNDRARRRAWWLEYTSIFIIGLTTTIGHWQINARLLALRHAMGRPIDDVAVNDPLRVEFNSLHGQSVAMLSLAMMAALVAFVVIARRRGLSR